MVGGEGATTLNALTAQRAQQVIAFVMAAVEGAKHQIAINRPLLKPIIVSHVGEEGVALTKIVKTLQLVLRNSVRAMEEEEDARIRVVAPSLHKVRHSSALFMAVESDARRWDVHVL